MSYEILLEPRAVDQLNKKFLNSSTLLHAIERHLEMLEASPTKSSTKTPDNYPEKCQLFNFTAYEGIVLYLITFRFQYSQCETKLHITSVDKYRLTP